MTTATFFSAEKVEKPEGADLASSITTNLVKEDPYGICCALVSMETCYTVDDGMHYPETVKGYFNGFGC